MLILWLDLTASWLTVGNNSADSAFGGARADQTPWSVCLWEVFFLWLDLTPNMSLSLFCRYFRPDPNVVVTTTVIQLLRHCCSYNDKYDFRPGSIWYNGNFSPSLGGTRFQLASYVLNGGFANIQPCRILSFRTLWCCQLFWSWSRWHDVHIFWEKPVCSNCPGTQVRRPEITSIIQHRFVKIAGHVCQMQRTAVRFSLLICQDQLMATRQARRASLEPHCRRLQASGPLCWFNFEVQT